MALSRRELVHGQRRRGQADGLRPPWSLSRGAFEATCDASGACLRACPEGILVDGEGRLPRVDLSRGGCTFCGACVSACPSGALDDQLGLPWRFRAEVSARCLGARGVECRACADWCEARAIRFAPPARPSAPLIDRVACTGCGACVAPCPTDAIHLQAVGDRVHA